MDQILSRSFGSWFASRTRAEEETVFDIAEQAMEAEQGGGLEDHGSMEKPSWTEKVSPEAEEETVKGMEVWGSSAGSLQHQELVFEEQVFGEKGPGATALEKLGRPEEQMQK